MSCCPCHLRRHSRLPSHPCYLVVALYSPRRCLAVASPSPRRRLAVASPSPCRRLAVALLSPVASPSPCRCLAVASPSPHHHLAPPFARHHHHHVQVLRRPTRTVTATVIAIGIIGRYPYRCCCHHQHPSSYRRLRCLRRRCPDVSVAPNAPASPPLPPSFVMDPTAVRLRLATVPRKRRRRRQRRRRSVTDVTAPTAGAALTTPSSAWRTGSSSARSSQQRRVPLRRQWGVRRS